eukprot:g19335.t1
MAGPLNLCHQPLQGRGIAGFNVTLFLFFNFFIPQNQAAKQVRRFAREITTSEHLKTFRKVSTGSLLPQGKVVLAVAQRLSSACQCFVSLFTASPLTSPSLLSPDSTKNRQGTHHE